MYQSDAMDKSEQQIQFSEDAKELLRPKVAHGGCHVGNTSRESQQLLGILRISNHPNKHLVIPNASNHSHIQL